MKQNQTTTLECTTNYDLFEPHPYNRDISRTKILEQSMAKFGFDDGLPIRCIRNGNGKLKITHGHHRFHVARKLGLPIWYIIASNNIPLFDSEASGHSWGVKDFTVARARAGERPAEVVMRYHQQTGIPLNACISLIGGENGISHNKIKSMKLGWFKIGDITRANIIAEIVQHCKKQGVKFAANSYFVGALYKCLLVDEFDAELFMHKVATHIDLMEPRRNVDDYLELIELVYNRKSLNKFPLMFHAKEASAKRSASFSKNPSA